MDPGWYVRLGYLPTEFDIMASAEHDPLGQLAADSSQPGASAANVARQPSSSPDRAPLRRQRRTCTPRSCSSCQKGKLKCVRHSPDAPCERCQRAGKHCERGSEDRRERAVTILNLQRAKESFATAYLWAFSWAIQLTYSGMPPANPDIFDELYSLDKATIIERLPGLAIRAGVSEIEEGRETPSFDIGNLGERATKSEVKTWLDKFEEKAQECIAEWQAMILQAHQGRLQIQEQWNQGGSLDGRYWLT